MNFCPTCGEPIGETVLCDHCAIKPVRAALDAATESYMAMLERQNKHLRKELHALEAEMHWLDQHCSFVADHTYSLGPFRVGELRLLAQAGLAADEARATAKTRHFSR